MALFHLHIDATHLSGELHDHVRDEYGFIDSQFSHLPIDVLHFEAPTHLTIKTDSKQVLRSTFDSLKALFSDNPGFQGYLEAEVIMYDDELVIPATSQPVATPFVATIGNLPPNQFRETELHVDFVNDDPRCDLAEGLRAMGFYTAFMQKPRGLAQIFTLQGSKEDILSVAPAVRDFVTACGGGTHCSIKEERIVDWWVCDAELVLPPVVCQLDWSSYDVAANR